MLGFFDHARNSIWKLLFEMLVIFCIGGFAYLLVEIAFRGYTHPTMFFLGGLCFLTIGYLNEKYPWEMPLVCQMVIASLFVTAMEFLFGILLNKVLGLNVWDYSDLPYNLCGQICLVFSVGWFFLSMPAIIVDDWLRWALFKEDVPVYTIFCTRVPGYRRGFHRRE